MHSHIKALIVMRIYISPTPLNTIFTVIINMLVIYVNRPASMGNHQAVGVSSERRHSSCSSIFHINLEYASIFDLKIIIHSLN